MYKPKKELHDLVSEFERLCQLRCVKAFGLSAASMTKADSISTPTSKRSTSGEITLERSVG